MNCGKLLGSKIEFALARLGITSDRVSKLLGRKCKCAERKAMLNRLHIWLLRLERGNSEGADKYLNEIVDDYSI